MRLDFVNCMYCPKCGGKLQSDQRACPECGAETSAGRSNDRLSNTKLRPLITYFESGEFTRAGLIGVGSYISGLLLSYILIQTFLSNLSTGYELSRFTVVTLYFYAGHFVTILVNGQPYPLPALLYFVPALTLPIGAALSKRITRDSLLENTLGFASGYLAMAVVGSLTLTTGNVETSMSTGYYRADLLDTVLLMGLGFPLVYGAIGSSLPRLRSGRLSKNRALGIGVISPWAIPILGSLIAMYSGKMVSRRHGSKWGYGVFLWGVITLLGPVLIILFIIFYLLSMSG